MKKFSVGEVFVQRKGRKGGEQHFISSRNETYLSSPFFVKILRSVIYIPGYCGMIQLVGHKRFSKSNLGA